MKKMIKTKLLILLINLFLHGVLYSQQNDTIYIDKEGEKGMMVNGLKEGEYVYMTKDGVVYLKENYSKGKLHGKVIYYYFNAPIKKSETNYVNGLKEGEAFDYNEDGSVSILSHFYRNKVHGKKINYSYRRGKKEFFFVKEYWMGKLHGDAVFFDKGDTSIVYQYSNDQMISQKLYEEGKLAEEGFVCEVIGDTVEIYVDENAYTREREHSYLRDGVWLFYDEKRQAKEVKCYKCGTIVNCEW